MKKYLLLVIVIVIAAFLSLVNPPSALAERVPTGDRIGLWNSAVDFPADAAFYIQHGWLQFPEDRAIGVFDFKLEIDGVFQGESYMLFAADGGDPNLLTRLWVFNCPNGMSGTHTFTGHWYAPCQYAVDSLGYEGTCATPNAKVETNSRTTEVTFIP